MVLLIPALAGVPGAPGRWQPLGAGQTLLRFRAPLNAAVCAPPNAHAWGWGSCQHRVRGAWEQPRGHGGGSPKLLVSIPDHPSQLLQRGLHCSGGDAAHIQPLSCSGVLANVHRTCLRSQGRPVLPCLTHPCCHVPSRLARRGTVGLQGGSQVWTPMGCPVCL